MARTQSQGRNRNDSLERLSALFAGFAHEVTALGERPGAGLAYRGSTELSEAGAWREALAGARKLPGVRAAAAITPTLGAAERMPVARPARMTVAEPDFACSAMCRTGP